jgi:uncharacterized membrane protein YhaH (DUF805 family)
MEWMFKPLKRYADFQGRSGRMEFWMFVLFIFIVGFVLQILAGILAVGSMSVDPNTGAVVGGAGMGLIGIILLVFELAVLVPSIAVAVRRMHDQDKSGWFILIPIYNLVLYCMPGTPGPNRFGPDPQGGDLSDTFK